MNWILFVMIAIIIGLLVWQWVRNNRKEDKPQTVFLFKYYIGKEEGKPIEFLEEWKILHLENHLYILNISLDIDNMVDMFYYLSSIWKDYKDDTITLEVYENLFIEGRIVHKFLGRYKIYKGGLRQVGG